jgi:hypothetical protein
MTAFEEMRLRAIKFCELAKLGINIRPVAEVITIDSDLAWYNAHCQVRGNEEKWRRITHEQFIKEAERIGKMPFPTLLEAQGWISVKDQLPPMHKRVLVIDDCPQIGFGAYIDLNGNWTSGFFGDPNVESLGRGEITHWKPLELPKP